MNNLSNIKFWEEKYMLLYSHQHSHSLSELPKILLNLKVEIAMENAPNKGKLYHFNSALLKVWQNVFEKSVRKVNHYDT